MVLWVPEYTDGIAQDCGNSIANAMELPQPYAKPLNCVWALNLFTFNQQSHHQFLPLRHGMEQWGTIPTVLCVYIAAGLQQHVHYVWNHIHTCSKLVEYSP